MKVVSESFVPQMIRSWIRIKIFQMDVTAKWCKIDT